MLAISVTLPAWIANGLIMLIDFISWIAGQPVTWLIALLGGGLSIVNFIRSYSGRK